MDEHGEVGAVVSVTESSTVSVTVSKSDETLAENIGGERQEEEGSYSEGDGEEIMVEIVGSDVFVDGVSGDGDGLEKEGLEDREMESIGNDDVVEGETGSREVGYLEEGQVWDDRTEIREDEEVVGVSDGRGESAVAMEGVEIVTVSTSEETHIVAKRVEVTFVEKVEEKRGEGELVDRGNNAVGDSVQSDVVNDEVWNPGVDAMAGVQQESVVEEGAVKVQEQDPSCKEEIPGIDDCPMVEMNENISKTSTEDGENHESSESSDHPTGTTGEENVGVVNAEEEASQSPIGVTIITVVDQNLQSSDEGTQIEDNPVGKTNGNHEILDTDSISLKPVNDSRDCEVAMVDQVSSRHSHELLDNIAINSSVRDDEEVAACIDLGSSDHVHTSHDQSADFNVEEHKVEGRSMNDDLDVGEHEEKVKPVSNLLLHTEPEDAGGETQIVEQEENLAKACRDSDAEPEASGGPTADMDVEENKVDGKSMNDDDLNVGVHEGKVKPVSDLLLYTEPEDYGGDTQVVEQEENLTRASRDSGAEPVSDLLLYTEPGDYGGDTEVVEQEGNLTRASRDSNAEPVSDLLYTEPEDYGGDTEVVEQEENLTRASRDSAAEPEASGGPTADMDVEEHKVKGSMNDDLDVGEHGGKVEPVHDLLLHTDPEDAGGETQVVEQEENLVRASRDTDAKPEASGGPTAGLDVDEHKEKGRSINELVLGGEPNYAIEETQVVEQDEDPVGTSGGLVLQAEASENKNENISYSEDLPSMQEEAASGHAIPESSNEPSSVVERGEWMEMDIDEVIDFKDEVTDLDAATGNSDGKPTENTDQVDIAGFHMTDVETNTKDGPMLEEPVQSQSKVSEEQLQVAAGDVVVTAVTECAHIGEEVLDSNAPILENEKSDIGGGTVKEFANETNIVASNEQIGSVTSTESVETQGAGKVPDSDAFPNSNPPKGAEAGVLDASVQRTDSDVEASFSVQDKKQDEAVVLDEAMHNVDLDQSKDRALDDKVSEEGVDNSAISDVQASCGSQFSTDFTGFHDEGNVASSLQVEDQNLNTIGVSDDKSVFEGHLTVETSGFEIETFGEAPNQATKGEDECLKDDDHNLLQVVVSESDEGQLMVEVGEHNDYGQQSMVIAEHASEPDESKILEKETLKPSSSFRIHQSGYLQAPENEDEFSTSDLVWGKVRSHPWWPGQIFDPEDASEKAVKYYKNDSFLVAYFGDRTFAWNDASVLKPFRSHFSEIEKQSNSEVFQSAVSSALGEVSRRVELGLSCSCTPRDAYERIECQIVENTGIREESSRRYGVDESSGATSFEPDKLLQHIRLLAQSPFGWADRLELTLANAQLSAFCRFKGYRPPPTFMSEEASFETGAATLTADGEQVLTLCPLKRKLSINDGSQPNKKERNMSELMGDMAYSPDDEDDLDGKGLGKSVSTSAGRKRKAVDPITDGSDRRISIYAAKVSTTSSSPKPSFKVGECIRKIASQLTGSASILKSTEQQGNDASLHASDNSQKGDMLFPADISLEEMLSQLQLAAREPKKGYSFLNNIILFFSVFRNSVVTKHASGRSGNGKKRKDSNAVGGSAEEFEFDDVNDSYWTDRIVHNYSEEQLLLQNGDGDYPLSTVADPDKFQKPSRRSYSRKQYSNGMSAEEAAEEVERRKLSPAGLVLTFAEGDTLPSETNLNKMFRRFGPLRESETEIDQDSHRARVIFKRGSDAEVAHSSAGTFKIFGPKLVSYQLNYLPSTTLRVLPLLISQGQEYAP